LAWSHEHFLAAFKIYFAEVVLQKLTHPAAANMGVRAPDRGPDLIFLVQIFFIMIGVGMYCRYIDNLFPDPGGLDIEAP
jgi:hypothetical protein